MNAIVRGLIQRLPAYAKSALDLTIGTVAAVIALELALSGDFSISSLTAGLYVVLIFGYPLVFLVASTRYVRRAFGTQRTCKAGTSLVLATGIYYLFRGIYGFLEFMIPFVGSEIEKTSRGAGMGFVEGISYVLEGIVWSTPLALWIFPNVRTDLYVGVSILAAGVVLEATRVGFSRYRREVNHE